MSNYDRIKAECFEANLLLPLFKLIDLTFGNVSVADPDQGVFAIKPSGVDYALLTENDIVVIDMEGQVVEGALRPSSDTPTHRRLFRAFKGVRSVVHSHSRNAVAFAQAGRGIPCLGTTHADYFYGEVPVTRPMTPEEVRSEYEWETGNVIVERFKDLDPAEVSAVLVNGHGPFVVGAERQESGRKRASSGNRRRDGSENPATGLACSGDRKASAGQALPSQTRSWRLLRSGLSNQTIRMTKPIVFGLVGGAWRAEFYFRIAQALPERFRVAGCVAKSESTRSRVNAAWNIPVFDNIGDLLNEQPEFVVTSVPWAASEHLLVELASQNMPVLAETPPASDLEGLIRLWQNLPDNARIQVAEQYAFQPLHAARLAFVRSGKLGEISQVQVSAAHGYHGISLIRKFLDIDYENVAIRAFEFKSPLVAGPDRSGPPSEEKKKESLQTIAYLQFDR